MQQESPNRFWFYAQMTFLVVACGTMTACLVKNKKNYEGRTGSGGTFDSQSFIITRTTGKTTAVVQFNTARPLLCAIDVYSQDASQEPKQESPLKYNCPATVPVAAFRETIAGLNPSYLYFYRVFAWDADKTKDKAEIIIVKELPSNSVDTLVEADGKFRNLFISRVDLPLKSDEVHRHLLAASTSPQDLRTKITRPIGCRAGELRMIEDLAAADQDLRLSSVATRGFAAATAQPHLNYRERLKLSFSSFQFSDRWEWVFDIAGKTQSFFAKPGPKLNSVEVTSVVKINIQGSGLADPESPVLTLDSTKSLNLIWKADPPLDISRFIFQVGKKSSEGTFHCVFDLKDGQGIVESSWLASLPKGKHPAIATVESHQLQVEQNTGAWLLTSYDWKSAGVEK